MESPLQKIIDWYLSLPVEQRSDIAFMVGSVSPGFDIKSLIADLDQLENIFLETLEKAKQSKLSEVGMVVLLRGAIPHFVIRNRKSPEDWKKNTQFLNDMSVEMDYPVFEESARKMEFRSAQWQSTCKKWASIEASFSSDLLDSYMMTD